MAGFSFEDYDKISNNNDCEQSFNGCSYTLDTTALIFALMHDLNLKHFIDSLIPKVGPQVKITHAEAIMVMIARFLCPSEQKGLCNIKSFLDSRPIPALLQNTDIVNENINEYVLGEALDAIAAYGTSRFSFDIMSKLIEAIHKSDAIKTIHIDSTSKALWRNVNNPNKSALIANNSVASQNQDNTFTCDCKEIYVKYGYSRDGNSSQPQVNTIHITTDDRQTGAVLPILSHTYSGNINDIEEFANILSDSIEHLISKYKNLKVIVGDSALATPRSVEILHSHNVHLLSRLSDKRVKDDLLKAARNEFDFITINVGGVATQAAYAGEYEFKNTIDGTVVCKGKKIIVKSLALQSKKQHTIERWVELEKKSIKKQVKAKNLTLFNCKADAQKAFDELRLQLKYHKAVACYEEHKQYEKKGRPKKDDPYTVKYSFSIELSIDNEAIEKCVEKESYYVLVTTDTQDEINIQELVEEYHKQSNVEETWKTQKSKGLFIDTVYLHSPKRICALMLIQSLALFVSNYLLELLHKYMQEHQLIIPISKNAVSTNPTWFTFSQFINRSRPSILCDKSIGSVMSVNINEMLFLQGFLQYLGKQYVMFYDARYYNMYYQSLIEFKEYSHQQNNQINNRSSHD